MVCYWYMMIDGRVIINCMLFGKLLEGVVDGQENDLTEMELELRQGIQKAKEMAAACKSNADEEGGFATNEAGVTSITPRN